MVRFFIQGRGEVSWTEMALKLDRRQAAMYGTPAWVLLGKLELSNLRKVVSFLQTPSANTTY